MPRVSVIIPTYNCGSYICQAVDSALAQTMDDLEVIVVDDGSTDDTRQRLRTYGSKIRYVYQENRERSAARNAGIECSSAEFIAFLDADDLWLPHKLERQLPALENDAGVGMVYCWAQYVDAQGSETESAGRRAICSSEAGPMLFEKLLFGNFIAASSSATVRRSCFSKVGPFDESLSYGEDWDLWLRLSFEYSIAVVPEILTYYRVYEAGPLEKYKRQDVVLPIVKRACTRLRSCHGNAGDLRRRALSAAYWESGRRSLIWDKRGSACRYLLRSLAYEPGRLRDLDSTVSLAEAFLGARQVSFLRTLKRRFSHSADARRASQR